jgi:glycosyltransferase involved in cell wall biosynthesis
MLTTAMMPSMSKIKRVAFLTRENPLDKRSWSGIYFRMLDSLKNEFDEVIPIGPIELPAIEYIVKMIEFLTRKLLKKKYLQDRSLLYSRTCALVIKMRLRHKNFDAIFCPTSSPLIAHLKTNIPIFHYSDATSHLMVNYYEYFTNLSYLSLKESNWIEKRAIRKANTAIYSSDWAARDAISTYHSKIENTFVIKMGANIKTVPKVIPLEKKLSQKICNLLFLGVDWQRKGGEIVLKTLELLLDQGFDAQLIVCGCIPPVTHPGMTVYPFLNKNLESDYEIFTQLLEDAHFLFVPTRAECAGIVYCEAAANGIPAIATDTGGVSSYVINSVTGYTLPLSAPAEEYAKIIKTVFTNKELYAKLSQQSRKEYFDELNWEVWAKKIRDTMENQLHKIKQAETFPGEVEYLPTASKLNG